MAISTNKLIECKFLFFIFLEEIFLSTFQRNGRNFNEVHTFSQSCYTEVLLGHRQALNWDGWKDFSGEWCNEIKAQMATQGRSNNLNYFLYAFNY